MTQVTEFFRSAQGFPDDAYRLKTNDAKHPLPEDKWASNLDRLRFFFSEVLFKDQPVLLEHSAPIKAVFTRANVVIQNTRTRARWDKSIRLQKVLTPDTIHRYIRALG